MKFEIWLLKQISNPKSNANVLSYKSHSKNKDSCTSGVLEKKRVIDKKYNAMGHNYMFMEYLFWKP